MKKQGSEAAAASSTGNLSSSSGTSFATAASIPVAANVPADKDASQSSRRSSRALRPSQSSRSSRLRRSKSDKGKERLEPAQEEPVQDDHGLKQNAAPEPPPVTTSCDVHAEVVGPQDGKLSKEPVSDGTVKQPGEPRSTVDQEQVKPLETPQGVSQATLPSTPAKAKQQNEAAAASAPAGPTSHAESGQKRKPSSRSRGTSAAVDEPHDAAAAAAEASTTHSPTKPSSDPEKSASQESKAPSLDRLRKLIEEDMCPLDFSWPNIDVKTDHANEFVRCPRMFVLLIAVALLVATLVGVALMAGLLRRRNHPAVSLCLSLECREYALRLSGSVNRSVPPCDSFTRFVCDGWSSGHTFSVRELLVAQAMQTMGRLQTMVYVPKTGQSNEERGAAVYRSCNSLLIGRRDDLPAVRDALKEAGIIWPRRPAKVSVLHTILTTSLRLGWDVLFRLVPQWSPHLRLLVNSGRTIMEVLNKTTEPRSLSKKQTYFAVLRENMLEPGIRSVRGGADEVTFQEVGAVEEETATTLRRSYYKPDVPPVAVPNIVDVPELGLSRGVWERTLTMLGFNNSGRITHFEVFTANPQYVESFLHLWKRLGDSRTHLFVSWYTVQVAALFANQALISNFYDGDSRRALALHTAFCLGQAYAVSGTVVFSSYSRHSLRSTTRHDAGRLTLAVRESFRKRVAQWKTLDEDVTVVSNWASLETAFEAFGGSEDRVPPSKTTPSASGNGGTSNVTDSVPDVSPDMTEESLVTNLRKATRYFARTSSHGDYTSDVAATAMSVGISTLHMSAALYSKGDFILMPYSLSFPLYDYQLIPAANYGGLGAEVARVLGQLFIEAYRVPEASRSWLTRLEDCLLANALIEEQNVFMTMAEAVSFGALVDAYDVHVSDEGDDSKRLPGLQEFTGRQLLFMALCFMKCRGRGTGKTPPWACNLPLKHMPEFARTFGCQHGTPMNPMKKCELT